MSEKSLILVLLENFASGTVFTLEYVRTDIPAKNVRTYSKRSWTYADIIPWVQNHRQK